MSAFPDVAEARREIARRVSESGVVALVTHVNPDGDAVGSLLGMHRVLLSLGKRCWPVSDDGVPWSLSFLPNAADVVRWDDVVRSGTPELILALDCSDLERTGLTRDGARLLAGVPLAEIDHHVTNTAFGDVSCVDPTAACVGLMAFEQARELGAAIDPDTATCLLTALYTDTGSFQYSNADPRAFRAAAALLELGGRHTEIARLVFRRKRFGSARLWGLVLSTLVSLLDGRYVEAIATLEAQRGCGVVDEGSEGLAEYIAGIDGADLVTLYREASDGAVKVSFRSSERVDASALARGLGGGGHPRAAGCSLPGPLDAARERVRVEAMPAVARTAGIALG